MHTFALFLAFAFGSISSSTYADSCVRVRDGKDGYMCMKFDSKEKAKASKYGLRLGSPYEAVKQRMKLGGWDVDRKWLKEEEEEAFYSRNDWLVCGHGWDAICWTTFEKGKKKVSAVFSGTQDGYPLISIKSEP